MTKITLSSNASGTGNVNFAAPNTNSAITVTLPTSNVDMDALGPSTTAGDVGTYAFLREDGNDKTQVTFGGTRAGSSLHPVSLNTWNSNGPYVGFTGSLASAVSGTWRCMGNYSSSTSENDNPLTVWLRIS